MAPGRIMFEIDGVTPELAREALTLGAAKLPIKTKFIAADRRRLGWQKLLCTKPATSGRRRRMSLDTLLIDLRKEQFNLRFQRATGQAEGTGPRA